jgi:4-amino-4-deoxy-L-arabinose transferase-like glycosyltransferase
MHSTIDSRRFILFLALVVAGAIIRSAVATRLDNFTVDEYYHIAAGVSYVQTGDFRVNPEHPPLVKLWVGSVLSATGFRLRALRAFHDKSDERRFTADAVFLQNNPDSVQRRSRIAMLTLNGLLLIALALALRTCFNDGVALGTMLFLAIDPTVSAHLPVVMTDLPVALLAATAVVLATRAFRTWSWRDLAWCAIALGLALGAKHSAPIFCVFLGIASVVLAVVVPSSTNADKRSHRLAKVCAVLLGALVILWSFYFFRFHEGNSMQEPFNRPLKDKIADISSPANRFVLSCMSKTHVVPRPGLWKDCPSHDRNG